MSPRTVRPLEAITAGALAAAAAAAAVLALTALSQPSQFGERLAALQAQTASLRRLTSSRSAPSFPPDALCTRTPQAQAERVRAEIASAAAALQLDHVVVQAAPQRAADGGLLPVEVHVSASGSYEAVLEVLQHLSSTRPLVFIDTVDLASKTSFVSFNLSGHVFCSAPH